MSEKNSNGPRERKRRSQRPSPELNTRALVEDVFRRGIPVRLDGKRTTITGFEAVYRQLLKLEVSGDPRALEVRLRYERFAESRLEPMEQKIVVIGGLPHDDNI